MLHWGRFGEADESMKYETIRSIVVKRVLRQLIEALRYLHSRAECPSVSTFVEKGKNKTSISLANHRFTFDCFTSDMRAIAIPYPASSQGRQTREYSNVLCCGLQAD